MSQIKELLDILGDRPLLTADNAMGRKAQRLARWLRKQEDPTDEAARKAMGMVRNKPAYRKVKYHLRIYLLNSITSISTAAKVEAPGRPAAHRYLWHQLATISAAPRLFANPVGEKVLDEIVTEAERHNLGDQITQAKVLLSGGEKKIWDKRMGEKDVQAVVRRNYVEAVIRRQFSYSVYMNRKRFPVEKKIAVLKGFITDLKNLNSSKDKYITLKELYLKIKISLYENDLNETKAVHQQAMKILEALNLSSPYHAINFHANLIRCYIKSDAPAEGLPFVKEILQTEGVINSDRYIILEPGLVLALKANAFEVAERYYYQVIEKPSYKKGGSDLKETIEIIKAYLILLTSSGHLRTETAIKNFSKLRIHKFTNDLIVSQKDKGLRNLHVIIIKLMDFCLHKKGDDFDLGDAIRKYTQRHLKEEKYNRVKSFILALLQHPEHGYNNRLTKKYAKKHLELMRSKKGLDYSNHAYLEIVSYDFLWEVALKTGGKSNCRFPE